MDYKPATDEMMDAVRRVARRNHVRLKGLHLAVVQQDKASKSKGKTRLAFCTRPSAVTRPLLERKDTAFIICIAADEWNRANVATRVAIVDHELCHCGVGDAGPYIRPHDYEEFAEIVGRHGFWRQDLAEKAIRQAALDLPETDGEEPHVGTIRDRSTETGDGKQGAGENGEHPTSNVEHPTSKGAQLDEDADGELVERAMQVLRDTRRASTSALQRRLKIGFTRALRVMDLLEARGIVGPTRGAEPREILVDLDAEMAGAAQA